MIFKFPIILFLVIPVIASMVFFRSTKVTHSIRFPKASWMKTLASSKAANYLKASHVIEVVTIILLIITLAQPQWVKSEKYSTKKGIDIVAILDTSGSMNAEDFKPKNRMEVAKETLQRFIRKRKDDRVGLIVFGSDALTKSPITYDHNIINHHIKSTKVGDAGDGTAIGLAIATGINRLENAKATSKLLILITDGVNNAGQIDPISAAKLASKKGIKVYTIGIGDKKGAPIPIYHPTYGKRYARYPNGQLVLTEFDDTVLKEISEITNAKFFNATNTEELNKVYQDIDALEKTVIQTSKNFIVLDLFPYLIGLIGLLVLLREIIALTALIGVRT
jgi:Ca-activated chloride channel family protein